MAIRYSVGMRYTYHSLVVSVALLTMPAWLLADVVDDFESYGNTTALQAAWQRILPVGVNSLSSNPVRNGSQSMQVVPDFSFGVTVLRFSLSPAVDWSSATTVSVWYRGQAGNAASVELEMQLLSTSGQELVDVVAPRAAETTEWTELVLPLSGQAGLTSVGAVQLAISGFNGDAGTMWFDDLEVNFPGAAPGVSIEAVNGTDLSEGGGSRPITLTIASQPTHNVTVTPQFDSSELTVSPNSRTITTGAWEIPAAFTVEAIDDDDIEGNMDRGVSFSLVSSDASYSLTTSNTVFGISDNDFLVEPTIDSYVFDGTNFVISFTTELNQNYGVDEKVGINDPEWVVRTANLTGIAGRYDIPIAPTGTSMVFRITSEPAP